MDWKPICFIEEPVEVSFEQTPLLEKVPNCPSGFIWLLYQELQAFPDLN